MICNAAVTFSAVSRIAVCVEAAACGAAATLDKISKRRASICSKSTCAFVVTPRVKSPKTAKILVTTNLMLKTVPALIWHLKYTCVRKKDNASLIKNCFSIKSAAVLIALLANIVS